MYVGKKKWEPSEGIELEPNALQVIKDNDNNYCITAGPGSGKTELLAQKVTYLLQENVCIYPKRILAISFKKDARKNLKDRVQKRCDSDLSERFDSHTYDSFAKDILDRFRLGIHSKYRPPKDYQVDLSKTGNPKDLTKLNFERICKAAKHILNTNPHILKAFRATYSHVLLDEFQDTTTNQYELIKTVFFSKTRLIAVGDEKQRIMVWAGADPEVFNKFIKDFNAKKISLFANYRSNPPLVQLQKHMINAGKGKVDPIPTESSKENSGSCSIWLFDNEDTEAKTVAKYIKEVLENDSYKPDDVCVIVKQKSQLYSQKLIQELSNIGIEARVFDQLQDLMSEELTKLILDSFKIALGRSPSEFSNVYGLYKETRLTRVDVVPKWEFYRKIDQEIIKFSKKIRDQLSLVRNPDDLHKCIDEVIAFFGIEKLKNIYPKYKQGTYLTEIKNKISLELMKIYEESHNWSDSIRKLKGEGSLPIMTIHKSKGLEYKIVIFMGLEDQAFWSFQSQSEEDTCAFFVALSRAKEKVIFTFSEKRDFLRKNPQTNTLIRPLYDLLVSSKLVDVKNF
ncbi:MAG: ATP-dependent helicase [Candidatus Gottesmanbacteria bacterium]|nr:ATP-dependent helicase [Candidatus Gottesmanbacteria bacterium]